MKQIVLALLVFVCVLRQSQANAQWYGGGGYGVGTAASAEEHGIADIVRSQGMYEESASRAMNNYEDARSKYIDNEKKWTEFYYWRKRTVRAEKAKEREERRAENDRYFENRAAHAEPPPPRLLKSQLNPATGEIKWPLALQRDWFVTLRQDMEILFSTKAQSGLTSEMSMAIQKKTDEIQGELRKHVKEIVGEEFIQARKFLKSLPIEGRTPTSPGY